MKFLAGFLFLISQAHAAVLLKDIGIIGLSSHDLFTWDKVNEVNLENGRFDLSTIFDYEGGKRWKKGGNPKNSENAPVYSITMALVEHYKGGLKNGLSPEEARRSTVKLFHAMIKDSFTRLSGLSFPREGVNQEVTNTEQASLRGMHDILPGRIKLFDRIGRKELVVTNMFFAKTRLNEKELNQEVAYFDGDYDHEYKNIKIPFTKKTINLKKVDGEFIEKFSPYKQADMLAELALVGKGEMKISEVSFMHHLEELYAKGICSVDNPWMPDISCR